MRRYVREIRRSWECDMEGMTNPTDPPHMWKKNSVMKTFFSLGWCWRRSKTFSCFWRPAASGWLLTLLWQKKKKNRNHSWLININILFIVLDSTIFFHMTPSTHHPLQNCNLLIQIITKKFDLHTQTNLCFGICFGKWKNNPPPQLVG